MIGRTTVPMLAGVLLDACGYPGMLLGLMAGLCLVTWLAVSLRRRIFVYGEDSAGVVRHPVVSIKHLHER